MVARRGRRREFGQIASQDRDKAIGGGPTAKLGELAENGVPHGRVLGVVRGLGFFLIPPLAAGWLGPLFFYFFTNPGSIENFSLFSIFQFPPLDFSTILDFWFVMDSLKTSPIDYARTNHLGFQREGTDLRPNRR